MVDYCEHDYPTCSNCPSCEVDLLMARIELAERALTGSDERVQVQAQRKLKYEKPQIELSPCPFCGSDQGTAGVHLCVAFSSAPYIVECIACRGRTGGSQSFEEAAIIWNMRPSS